VAVNFLAFIGIHQMMEVGYSLTLHLKIKPAFAGWIDYAWQLTLGCFVRFL
jgi:hypothetical protein